MNTVSWSEIAEYLRGWHETHPNADDELTTEEIIASLHDESELLIQTLLNDDMTNIKAGILDVREILKRGFQGYNEMTNTELWDEMYERGLTL